MGCPSKLCGPPDSQCFPAGDRRKPLRKPELQLRVPGRQGKSPRCASGLSHTKEDGLNELPGHLSAVSKATSCPAWILIVLSLCTCRYPWHCVTRTTRHRCPARGLSQKGTWPGSHRHLMEPSSLGLYILSIPFILTANIKAKYYYGNFKYERAAACRISGQLQGIWDLNLPWVCPTAGTTAPQAGRWHPSYPHTVTQSCKSPRSGPTRFCRAGTNFHSCKPEWVKFNVIFHNWSN